MFTLVFYPTTVYTAVITSPQLMFMGGIILGACLIMIGLGSRYKES